MPAAVKHALMIYGCCDDVFLFVLVELGNSFQSEIVALCCTTGEHNFLSRGSNQVCHILCLFKEEIGLLILHLHKLFQCPSRIYAILNEGFQTCLFDRAALHLEL